MFNQYQPQDREGARRNIEAMYLGCLLKDHSLVDESTLSAGMFQDREHKNLFYLINKKHKQGETIDLISLHLLSDKEIKGVGGVNYIVDVFNSVASANQFKNYEKMIHDFFIQASVKDTTVDFLQDMSTAPSKERVERFMQDIQRVELETAKPAENFKSKLSKRYQEHVSSPIDGLSGIHTGSDTMNQISDGWQKKDLIIIGARPSMGKTLVGLGTGIEAMQADPDVMPTFMSAEMAIGGVIDRCIANIGRLNLRKLRNFNKFVQSDKDRAAYNNAMGVLEGSSLDIFEENTVPAIRARMRQRIKDNPGKKHICIIDFLTQLRPTDPTGNANIDYGNMVLDLKQMAKDLDIPVILLVQLNRQNEMRADKMPTMSDIRDTGVVEQAGDIIIFLHREYYYDKQADPNLLEINIAKNRQGQTGLAKLGVEMKFQRFYDLSRGA